MMSAHRAQWGSQTPASVTPEKLKHQLEQQPLLGGIEASDFPIFSESIKIVSSPLLPTLFVPDVTQSWVTT